MNSEDQARFKELITLAADTYSKEFTPTEVKNWWGMFKAYSIGEFEGALYAHMSDPDAGMFKPLPAHLMKHLRGTSKQNEQVAEDKAEMAWAVIEREIGRIGSYGTLKMEDKQALAAVQSIGGWKKLCGKTLDELTWMKKEFMSVYQNFERTPVEALPSKLPGRIELSEHKKEQGGMKSLADGLENFKATQAKI